MNNDLWQKFISTGRVEDYLIYKQNEYENNNRINGNADSDKGIDNKRTDYSGE